MTMSVAELKICWRNDSEHMPGGMENIKQQTDIS